MRSPTTPADRIGHQDGHRDIWGAPRGWVAWVIARALGGRPLVCLTAHDEAAESLIHEVRALRSAIGQPLDDDATVWVPPLSDSPYAKVVVERVRRADVAGALARIGRSPGPAVIALGVDAMMRKVMLGAARHAASRSLRAGDEIETTALATELVGLGWTREPMVDQPGQFAIRGGVIDLYSPVHPRPIRLELFGDRIESLRAFDEESQRTVGVVEDVALVPARDGALLTSAERLRRLRELADTWTVPSRAARQVSDELELDDNAPGIDALLPVLASAPLACPLEALPVDARWLVLEPEAMDAQLATRWREATATWDEVRARHELACPPDDLLAPAAVVDAMLAASRACVRFCAFEPVGPQRPGERVDVHDHAALSARLGAARAQGGDAFAEATRSELTDLVRQGLAVLVTAESRVRAELIAGILGGSELPWRQASAGAMPAAGEIVLVEAAVTRGFVSPGDGVAVVSAADLLGTAATSSGRARRRAKAQLGGAIGDFAQLADGDLLVHERHGVGRYRGLGLTQAQAQGDPVPCLRIEYQDGTLYLPVVRLGAVSRYQGGDPATTKLDKLGGETWAATKRKVSAQVAALAEELLVVYAQRAALPGHAYPGADDAYRDFAGRFPHQETPDQETAIEAVMTDLERARPMDRVVCGDVGYGKTEVALRAVFKVASAGRQAALLAPTTLLVEQHARTLAARFAGFPFTIAKLSRFQSKQEQDVVVRRLAEGHVDIVIGTHRLLSADIRFADLGLLVVDEEQRFGVAHKEKLRAMRTQLDVLSLSATPIPRTLHLALAGLRDLSIIATPPVDRRAVRTLIARDDDAVLREAIEHELARGGQVFFITPTIGTLARRAPIVKRGAEVALVPPKPEPPDPSLAAWAARLSALVPKARVAVAHGELSDVELEKSMLAFALGQIDVLVSTTIVESGIDIPNANTMIIARADRFGLAQLYQLRGRVGRASARAYCYLLIPPAEHMTDDARARLEVLQRHTELGAGFQVASRDLELRGGGELLGAKQSGAIASVGFDHYTRMLEAAIGELRGQPVRAAADPEVTAADSGYIPDGYVPDPGLRLDLYKRLASAELAEDLDAVVAEMRDRYGLLPDPCQRLVELMATKRLAKLLGVQALELGKARVAVGLFASAAHDRPRWIAKGWQSLADGRVVHSLPAGDEPAAVRARPLFTALVLHGSQ